MTLEAFFSAMAALAGLLFISSSMLAMGMSLTILSNTQRISI